MKKETYLQKAKREADTYYKQEMLEADLKEALRRTRGEPGLSILDVSNIVKKVLAPEEVDALKKML